MKKSINNKAVIAPLPVLIVCTYDENGIPDAMNAAWGGQCGYTNIALNLSSTHKTTRNIRSRGAIHRKPRYGRHNETVGLFRNSFRQ